MTIEQVNRQIQGGKLERETLLFILKNNEMIQNQAAVAINPAAKAAAENVRQYVACLVDLLPEEEARILRILYVEKSTWTVAEASLHMGRNTLGRHRNKAIQRMLDMANGTMEALA